MTISLRATVFAIIVAFACVSVAQEPKNSDPGATTPSTNPAAAPAQQPDAPQASQGPATQDKPGAKQDQSTPGAQNPSAEVPPASEAETSKKNVSPQRKPNAKRKTRISKSKTATPCRKSAAESNSGKCGQRQSPHNPGGQSGKVVVRNGGAPDENVQLAPSLTKEQQLQDKQKTEQLLATTDDNLKRLSDRQLTASQSSMLDQINAYMRQAKSANDAGDFARARTLAYKAHLLSDELMKR